MANDNQVSAVLTNQNVTDILGHITALGTLLPFLISRPPGDDNVMLGDKSVAFDEKCAGYMASNPELIPGYVDPAEVLKDRALRAQFGKFLPQLQLLAAKAADTNDVVGNEMMMANLAYYNSTGDAAKRGKTSAGDIHDDLSTRYPAVPARRPRNRLQKRRLRRETRRFPGETQPSRRDQLPSARAILPVERETEANARPGEAVQRPMYPPTRPAGAKRRAMEAVQRATLPFQTPREAGRTPSLASQPSTFPPRSTSLAGEPPAMENGARDEQRFARMVFLIRVSSVKIRG